MISIFVNLYVLFSAFFVVEGTLTPNGTIPLDCGSQQTFTCSVTGTASWTISLDGVSIIENAGPSAARNRPRITTTDSGVTQSSTITITGFTTADNGGTIQCIDPAIGDVQGMANISVDMPRCPMGSDFTLENSTDRICSVNLTWNRPLNALLATFITVTYCPTSSLVCENIMNCTTSPCTISGLDPGTKYQFTVIPNNNCGSPTGCNWNTTIQTSSDCVRALSSSPVPPPTPLGLLLLLLLLLLLIPFIYAIGVLIVQRCCYKDKSYCEVFWCCWCCGCCTKGKSGRNSTEPMKSPTGDDDAQDKTGQKEEKLTYAALEFSEQAGSTGEKKVRSHEEPVQYAAVDHA